MLYMKASLIKGPYVKLCFIVLFGLSFVTQVHGVGGSSVGSWDSEGQLLWDLTKPDYQEEKKGFLDIARSQSIPVQDIIILHTKDGFKPNQIQTQKGQRYRIHVVNIDKLKKNISFMMDDFSQYHGTFYGTEVVFELHPKKEGLFPFHCPETQAKGKWVVYSSGQDPSQMDALLKMNEPGGHLSSPHLSHPSLSPSPVHLRSPASGTNKPQGVLNGG